MKWLRDVHIGSACFLSVFLWLGSNCTAFASSVWLVEPDTCLVGESESSCAMRVKVRLLIPPHDNLCVHLNGEQINCFAPNSNEMTINIVFSNDSVLSLNHRAKGQIASHQLVYRTLLATDFRQRTRLPWSLF